MQFQKYFILNEKFYMIQNKIQNNQIFQLFNYMMINIHKNCRFYCNKYIYHNFILSFA